MRSPPSRRAVVLPPCVPLVVVRCRLLFAQASRRVGSWPAHRLGKVSPFKGRDLCAIIAHPRVRARPKSPMSSCRIPLETPYPYLQITQAEYSWLSKQGDERKHARGQVATSGARLPRNVHRHDATLRLRRALVRDPCPVCLGGGKGLQGAGSMA